MNYSDLISSRKQLVPVFLNEALKLCWFLIFTPNFGNIICHIDCVSCVLLEFNVYHIFRKRDAEKNTLKNVHLYHGRDYNDTWSSQIEHFATESFNAEYTCEKNNHIHAICEDL